MKTLLVLTALCAVTLAIRDQSISVKGKLLCGSAPARNVRVKLWDEDDGPDPDDQLDAGYTDANGEFSLSGGTAELTGIDPVLKVYHDCDDGIKPGSRKVKFRLPSSYVTEGKVPKKTLDIGTINLEIRFQDEERELVVSRRSLRKHYEAGNDDDGDDGAVVTETEHKRERNRRQHDHNHDGHDHSKHNHKHRRELDNFADFDDNNARSYYRNRRDKELELSSNE